MSQNEGIDHKRRRVLIGTSAAIASIGMVGAGAAFVKSWNPSAKAKAGAAPISQDISSLEPGQRVVLEWVGKPIYVVNRTPEMLENLKKGESLLADPTSDASEQPEYAKNDHRSVDPKILVLTGVCTHLGCAPDYYPEVGAALLGATSYGGFYCPCHGSKYDLAGRVYKGVPAPKNLPIPPYKLEGSILTVGEV